MSVARVVARLSREPGISDYLLALAFAATAVAIRSILESIAPGIAYFVVLLPAVVVAGVFCGTAPALLTAAFGAATMGGLFFRDALLVWPPFNPTQLDTAVFLLACGTVLATTTALRAAIFAAATAEARLAEVFRQIPGAAAILEAPEGRLLLRSTQSDTVLDQPEHSVQRTSDLSVYRGFRPDGTPLAADDYPIVRALKAGVIIRGEHIRYKRADGRLVDLEVHAGPVRDAAGDIVAAVGMAFDVSDRVEAERRLRESEALYRTAAERLSAAIDAGALGLWELDLTTQRVRLDAALAAMLDLPPEPIELTRRQMSLYTDPADRARARRVFEDAVTAGQRYADELPMRTARNERRWFVTRGVVQPDASKIIGVMRDDTERHDREDALRSALEARDIIMREADHRIKNSLQLVVALLRLQLGRVTDDDARQALEAAIGRVTAVSQAHLALQHSDNLRTVNITQILTDLCQRLDLLTPTVTILCRMDVDLWLDAEQAIPLSLIASELLTNALRHAYPLHRPGEVILTSGVLRGTLTLTVADGGVGLSATPLRTGLGTTVVAALAKQIGAVIATQSARGQGTVVTVSMGLTATAGACAAD